VAADIICQWLRIMGRRTRWGSAPLGQISRRRRHLNRCWVRQIRGNANSRGEPMELEIGPAALLSTR